jgi:hypothetical protein
MPGPRAAGRTSAADGKSRAQADETRNKGGEEDFTQRREAAKNSRKNFRAFLIHFPFASYLLCGFAALREMFFIGSDERAAIKREINVQLGSKIIEEKSYTGATTEHAAM